MNKKVLLLVLLILKCNQSAEPQDSDLWKEFLKQVWKGFKPTLYLGRPVILLILISAKGYDYYMENQPTNKRLVEVEELLKHNNFQNENAQKRLKKKRDA